MKIYEIKFRQVEDGIETFSYYFKSLENAMDYVSNNFWFQGSPKLRFMDEVDSNCDSITFFPDFEDEARSAGRSAYPYFVRSLDVF